MGWRVGLDSFGSEGTSTQEPLAILRCRPPTQLVQESQFLRKPPNLAGNPFKKNLKFWLHTTTRNRLLLKPFLKNPDPHLEFDFRGGATLQLVGNIKPIR